MEGNNTEVSENHFPEDPKSTNIQNGSIQKISNIQKVSNFQILIILIFSGFTIFNIALSIFIVIRKFT